ncbi:small subunit ribosomal protein S6e [Nematocida sp. AWRm80]|nr:small subunit ribosomal protein S6e [Nematocida sp. AWRm80]
MKLNISSPTRTTTICIEVEYNVAAALCEKQIGDILDGSIISPEWSGFLLKITGGNDKQGFPMVPGLQKIERSRLLLKKGDIGFRCTRKGLRRRKSVRGCIVSHEIQTLNMSAIKEGTHIFPNLNDRITPLLKGPKRATKIRKLFNLSPDVTDLEPYVIGHEKKLKDGSTRIVKPKIRRLITEKRINRWQERITKRIQDQAVRTAKKKAYRQMMKEREAALSK